MPSASQQAQDAENRRFNRRKTLLSAKISTLDTIDDCVVRDLSSGGAEIRTLGAFQINQKVTLEMPRLGPVQGRVVWASGKLVGVQFMAPLDEVALTILAKPGGAPSPAPVATRPATAGEENRADLESRLLALSRALSHSDLEIAVEQIEALSRRRSP